MSDELQASSETIQPPAPDKASGMAIAALVLGILGFCCCGCLAGLPALVVGYIENGKIGRGESSEKGKWMVIVAMVLGIISLVMACVQVIWISFFGGLSVLQNLTHNLR